jgi:hypothetical protein
MFIGGEFQSPSVTREMFENCHGAPLFRNRPGGGDSTEGVLDTQDSNEDTESNEEQDENASIEEEDDDLGGFI